MRLVCCTDKEFPFKLSKKVKYDILCIIMFFLSRKKRYMRTCSYVLTGKLCRKTIKILLTMVAIDDCEGKLFILFFLRFYVYIFSTCKYIIFHFNVK